jgi:hypothetical protein
LRSVFCWRDCLCVNIQGGPQQSLADGPPLAPEVAERDVTYRLETDDSIMFSVLRRRDQHAQYHPLAHVDLVKLAKIAISPILGKGLTEFEVAFTNP